MKKTFFVAILFAILCALCAGQAVPTTPNVGMYLPPHGQQNWDFYLNSNFQLLDNIFGGSDIVPNFNATNVTIGTASVTNLSFGTGANFADDGGGGVIVLSNDGSAGMDLGESGKFAEFFYFDPSAKGGGFVATDQSGQCSPLYSFPNGGWYIFTATGVSTPVMMCGDTTGTFSAAFSATQLRVPELPFASIGTCNAGYEGGRASVSDSTTNTQGATVTGGGALHVAVYCNGTNWIVESGVGSGGGGGVTSVGLSVNGGSSSGIFAVTGSPITVSGTLNTNIAGTSGGVPYFSSSSVLSSSGALTANLPVIGGGAGVAPTVGTVTGNTTKFATSTGAIVSGDCAKWDASGNTIDAGAPCGTGAGGTGFVGVNSQTTSYTAVSGDNGKLVVMNCTAACTFTLYGTPTSGYTVSVQSIGSTIATVSLNSKNFNGASSVPVLNSFEPIDFKSDGTNYFGKPPTVPGTGITAVGTSNALTLASTYSSPLSGRSYSQNTGGVSALTTIVSVNTEYLWAFNPTLSFTSSKIMYDVATADNSANLYDLGVYDSTGTLICHLGATAGTTISPSTGEKTQNITCSITAGNRYYIAVTGNATTMTLGGTTSTFSMLSHSVPSVGSGTSGGALNSSVTLPSDNVVTNGSQPNLVLF